MSTLVDNATICRPYSAKKNEEYMCEQQENYFRLILEKWKLSLITDANVTLQDMKQKRENFPDESDLASYEENFRLELRARDRERKLIKKIDQSLCSLKINDYGFCDDCGSEIGILRLEARPTATKCIECKTVSELKEKQLMDV